MIRDNDLLFLDFCENECDMMESGSNAENARGSGAMEYSSGGQADRAGSVDGKMNVDIKPQDEVKKDSMDTQGKIFGNLPGNSFYLFR